MRVVLAQTAPLWGDAKGSGQAVLQSLSQVPPSTRMVLLPELWSCSYDNPRMEHHAKESPGLLDALAAWARDRRSGVLAGSLPWPVDGGMVNRTWLLNDTGSPVGFYDKTHLFPLLDEDRVFLPGSVPFFFDVDGFSWGSAICYDIRFPEYIRALALGGIDVLAVVAEWPRSRLLAWRTLVQARAIENQMYVLACNRCGEGGGEVWGGHSMVVAPDGTVLAEGGDGEELLVVDLELRKVRDMRRALPMWDHRRRELYEAVRAMEHPEASSPESSR